MRILLLCCLVAVCSAAAKPRITAISTNDVVKGYNKQELLLVDCRGAKAFAEGHIVNAIDGSIDDQRLKNFLPGEKSSLQVVLYGADGNDRSYQAVATRLAELGQAQLKHFKAGIEGWRKMRGPLQKGAMPEPIKIGGGDNFAGRPYLLHAAPIADGVKPQLVIWLHPASGDPKPEFQFWKQSGLFAKNRILLCPKATGRGWSMAQDGRWLERLIEYVATEHQVDRERIVLGGHSSGGFFTYLFGLPRQEQFSHLVIACAYWPVPNSTPPKPAKEAPELVLYHSPNDKVTPWKQMQKTKAQLEKLGYQLDLTEDKVGHSIGPKLVKRMKKVLAEAK